MSNRTLFYPKGLAGQGTDQVQSLFSYVEHLALSHQMKPRALLQTLFAANSRLQASDIPSLLKQQRIHTGVGLGEELRACLQSATGSSLSGATFCGLAHVLAPTNLMRTGMAYCPCCVQEDSGVPYIRLLWQVQCVSACPVHKVRLCTSAACGAAAADRLPPQRRPSVGGVCSQCGSVGHRCAPEHPESASREELWVAEQVARLIALPSDAAAAFTKEALQQGLRALVAAAYGGSVVRASRDAGLSRASVCTWVRGGAPALPWLLQLCFHAGADVLALLAGSFELLPDPWTAGRRHDVHVRPYKFSGVDVESVREEMRRAASSPNPPSVHEFARRHDMHIDTPRHRFAAEAKALSDAHRRQQERLRQEQYDATVAAYMRAAEGIQAKGKTVHVGVLQRESGLVAFSQNDFRVRAMNEVVQKFRQPSSGSP